MIVEINSKGEYSFDLNKFNEFIFETQGGDSSDITENYQLDEENGEMVLANRIIHESKNDSESSTTSIRYSLLCKFLDVLFEMENKESLTFGEEILINTMVENGLIKKLA